MHNLAIGFYCHFSALFLSLILFKQKCTQPPNASIKKEKRETRFCFFFRKDVVFHVAFWLNKKATPSKQKKTNNLNKLWKHPFFFSLFFISKIWEISNKNSQKKKQGIRDSGFIRKDKKRLAASSQRLQSILKSYGFTLRVFESESFKTSRS